MNNRHAIYYQHIATRQIFAKMPVNYLQYQHRYIRLLSTGVTDTHRQVIFEGNLVAYQKELYIIRFDGEGLGFKLVNREKSLSINRSILSKCTVMSLYFNGPILKHLLNKNDNDKFCRSCDQNIKLACMITYGNEYINQEDSPTCGLQKSSNIQRIY
jgi:hypothetical protein